MGLGFHVDGYETNCGWSHRRFYNFRMKLARSINIDLKEMNAPQSWDEVKSPLKYFLDHPDCVGELSPDKCGEIAPIMKIILFLWDNGNEADDYDKLNGFALVAAMEYCAAFNKPLIFC